MTTDNDATDIAVLGKRLNRRGRRQGAVPYHRHAPRDRKAVMMLVLQGECSPRVMVARLQLPVGTVMSRLTRARVKQRAQSGPKADTPIADLL
jgi:hypothetical protein